MPSKKNIKPVKKTSVKRILNCLPSLHVETDWQFSHAMNAGILAAPVSLPASKDLREAWWEIGDQGATGSCVGWACADGLLRWHLVKANRLGKSEQLSVRFAWMASKETDEFALRPTTFIEATGTSLKAALDVARKFGAVRDTVLPFASGKLYNDTSIDPEMTFYAIASQQKIASYFNLGSNLANWRSWIANKGPILTRLGVDATWYNATTNQGKLDVYQPLTVQGGHAVALVGYTANSFIVRNSWGKTWGDKGFGYASLNYAQAAFTEAYGVSL